LGDFGSPARLEVAFARNEVVLARLEVGIGQAVTLVFSTGWAQTVDSFREKQAFWWENRTFVVKFPFFVDIFSTDALIFDLYFGSNSKNSDVVSCSC
jgi:hypothetical protein